MIKIGGVIGALNTIALLFLTAITGIYYARIQGIQTLRSGIVNLYQNKAPFYELLSGASIAFAALLLIVPGFFTDFIGFLCFFPSTRKLLTSLIINYFVNSFSFSSQKNKKKSDWIEGEFKKEE